ncbi:Hypothetical predicted protein [Lecanosticta acicola]|uniref:Uncharacterized protein n=1 Tax=Lecanosticta acicola TaxID=111012 RepID=A0AAI8Z013_9PEZI|nr:Hypothetical predicted protein [Lecanosticta acicola]
MPPTYRVDHSGSLIRPPPPDSGTAVNCGVESSLHDSWASIVVGMINVARYSTIQAFEVTFKRTDVDIVRCKSCLGKFRLLAQPVEVVNKSNLWGDAAISRSPDGEMSVHEAGRDDLVGTVDDLCVRWRCEVLFDRFDDVSDNKIEASRKTLIFSLSSSKAMTVPFLRTLVAMLDVVKIE